MSTPSQNPSRVFQRRRRDSWPAIFSWLLSGMTHLGLILVWVSIIQATGARVDVQVVDVDRMLDVDVVDSAAKGHGDDGVAPGDGEEGTPGDGLPFQNTQSAEELLAESLSAPPTMYASSSSAGLPEVGAGPPDLSSGPSGTLLSSGGGTLLHPGGGGTFGTGGSGLSGTGDGGGGAGGDGGAGGTSLFGVSDAGRRFVYVLDNSGSMNSFRALQAAKNELVRSVEALDEGQQFLVIFYNIELTIVSPRDTPQRMFDGTDIHRLELSQQIAPIEGEGGTDHMLALREALNYHADVIFFLTDAGRPGLTTGQIEDITARNGGASRIHCIEFGENPEFARDDPTNPLRNLADRNHGHYTYKDVRTFQR
jgi:hypothetical protein